MRKTPELIIVRIPRGLDERVAQLLPETMHGARWSSRRVRQALSEWIAARGGDQNDEANECRPTACSPADRQIDRSEWSS